MTDLRRLPIVFASLALAACSARPARFADRPPVWQAHDDAPTQVPARSQAPTTRELFDTHLQRQVLASLEPRRIADAGDVNAFDEVPAGSWFRGDARPPESARPEKPLRILGPPPASGLGGISVVDAKGVLWELRLEGDRAAAAETLAGGLLRALGYPTPDVMPIDLSRHDVVGPDGTPVVAESGVRATAMRWPPSAPSPALDLGPTPLSGMRAGDPNDRVPHRDRRTLRALRDVFAWLAVPRLEPAMLRDAYIGPPGRGHTEHFVLARTGELWGPASERTTEDPELGRTYRNVGIEILSLGLAATESGGPTGPEVVTPADLDPRPPWEPLERVQPADAFWIGRRMMAISVTKLDAIVGEAGFEGAPRAALVEVLDARRRTLAARAYGSVTPCALVAAEAATVVLFDEAIASGFVSGSESRYVVEAMDDEGNPIAPARLVAPTGALVRAPLPAAPADGRIVLRVTSQRRGRLAPRGLDVHVVVDPRGPRVIALRH